MANFLELSMSQAESNTDKAMVGQTDRENMQFLFGHPDAGRRLSGVLS